MDRVRVMLWCTTCVPGMQLPLFAASAAGIFEGQGLTVEFIPPVPPRDLTLAGLSVRVNALDSGAADFAVTGVAYLLAAQAEADGTIGARFVTTLHQRSPIAAVVPANSDVADPSGLAGKPIAGHSLSWMVHEYQAALLHHDLEPGPVADANVGAYAALSLERGEVPLSPAWVDTIPTMQSATRCTLRTVALPVGVYATGLLARDRVPRELVLKLTEALAEGIALQRAQPSVGIDLYLRHYPAVSRAYLRLAWRMFEPNAPSTNAPVMAQDRWEDSIAFYALANDVPPLALDDVCRPELLQPAAGASDFIQQRADMLVDAPDDRRNARA